MRSVADPQVDRYLLVSDGERIRDEVRHHWVVYVVPVLECLLAMVLVVLTVFADMDVAWVLILALLALVGHAAWKALNEHMDRFVITNMRVFRVRGVFSQRRGTMPIARILDITVEKPLLGRVLGYGHFVFESAAQEQGVRDIRFVGDPDGRDLTIQQVIQESGVRGTARGPAGRG